MSEIEQYLESKALEHGYANYSTMCSYVSKDCACGEDDKLFVEYADKLRAVIAVNKCSIEEAIGILGSFKEFFNTRIKI